MNLIGLYLEEIQGIKECDDKEREVLVKELLAGSEEASQRLIEGHLKMAAEQVAELGETGELAEDLLGEANLALTMAVKEYAAGEGDFLDYLKRRIRRGLDSVLDDKKKNNEIKERVRDQVNLVTDASRLLAEELGREATVEELAKKIGMDPDQVVECMRIALNAMDRNVAEEAFGDGDSAASAFEQDLSSFSYDPEQGS
ncbi:MAG: RNA polymerase subunit sigma-70 [Lachnospiraceae bacterium]|nr:RNA polymerase subunit sigma-70 [Lachnospiraceae bacterium]